MIDPHWQLVDLDPFTWRNIGKFIDPGLYIRAGSPDERGLYLIHDRGKVLSIVETSGRSRSDLDIDTFASPQSLADTLYATGEWDRVHVVDRQHLNEVSIQAQQLENRELELDAYYHNVFRLIWGSSNGYIARPPHPRNWHGWTYTQIVEFLDQLDDPASLVIGVISDDGTTLEIGLIGEISNGSFRKVTTFESLPFPRETATITEEFMDRLWAHLGSSSCPPAAALLCTSSVFEHWVYGPDKRATIDSAIISGSAIVRLRENLTTPRG
jgi:hypothetical protein